MSTIPLKQLVTMSDDDIRKANPEEADKYITVRNTLNSTAKVEAEPKPKPKRKCTEKQLAALAAGRAKNPRGKKKVVEDQ